MSVNRIDTQDSFEKKWHEHVLPFVRRELLTYTFSNALGIKNHCNFFIHRDSNKCIVLLTGYSEPSLKYAELIFDFYQQGFSVFCMDHCAMGESQRILNNPQIVHIENFDVYNEDIYALLSHIQHLYPTKSESIFFFAHSTGGLILSNFLIKYTDKFPILGCILSAPLFGVNTKGYWSYGFYCVLSLLNKFGYGKQYTPGFFDYDPKQVKANEQLETNCVERFEAWRQWMLYYPESWMGGPSVHWLVKALEETSPEKITKLAKQIKIPLLIFSAGNDAYVENSGIKLFLSENSNHKHVFVQNSRHAIWMENNFIREGFLRSIEQFLNTVSDEGKTNLRKNIIGNY